MVKFNLFESLGYFGKKPKTFKREARKQIEQNTLDYLKRYGRAKWISVPEIFKETLEPTNLFNSPEGKMFFAVAGIKSKIHGATHKLRRDGYPIISGVGKKGYRYADEDCDDFVNVWDEKFSGWQKRKSDLIQEFKNDKEIIQKIIERLLEKKREQEAKELQKILVRYGEKQKEEE